MPGKSKSYAERFVISHLKKVDGKVHFGGSYNDDPFEYISYDGFTNPGKSVMKNKLIQQGISYERYEKYGGNETITIDMLLNSSIGDLIRIPLSDPDVEDQLGEVELADGVIPVVVQIDYQIDTAGIPKASTKLIFTEQCRRVVNHGISINKVVKAIAEAEYEEKDQSDFVKAVGKVT